MTRLRLQHRILLPFLLVTLVATSATAWVTLRVSTRALRSRVQAQLVGAANVLARGDLALNPAILQTSQRILGVEVLTVRDGALMASSLSEPRPALTAVVTRAIGRSGVAPADEPVVVSEDCGAPCLIAFRAVDGRPGTTVALVADTSELASTTHTVARAILLAAALGAIVLILVSQAVVRRVTAPLDRLVRFARQLSPEHPGERAPVGDDDVGVLAEAFNGMLDRLEHAQQALVRSEKLAVTGVLAARVAHDVRNPLFAIKMQVQLLRAGVGDRPEDAAILDAVLRDADQVDAVVTDLLHIARPADLVRVPVALAPVVEDALDRVRPQFTYRRLAIVVGIPGDLPAIPIDERRFRQALVNIFANAAEAMSAGGTLRVSAHRADGGVAIEVADDGTGLDPALVERVFDPFVSTKHEGVGLGLVNVRAVVEGHGGTVRLSPREPCGTCVTIWLPIPDPHHG